MPNFSFLGCFKCNHIQCRDVVVFSPIIIIFTTLGLFYVDLGCGNSSYIQTSNEENKIQIQERNIILSLLFFHYMFQFFSSVPARPFICQVLIVYCACLPEGLCHIPGSCQQYYYIRPAKVLIFTS